MFRYDAHTLKITRYEIEANHFGRRFPKSFSYVQLRNSGRIFLIEASMEKNRVCLELVLETKAGKAK